MEQEKKHEMIAERGNATPMRKKKLQQNKKKKACRSQSEKIPLSLYMRCILL
jgi:hypothetical protein